MLLQILRFLRGYARFTVRGRFPERFINIALKNRIRLWDVEKSEESLSACMYTRDYLRVRRFARGCGVRLRVKERKGLPTLLRRYSDRTGLVIGAAAFVITVFVMSLFIWSIEITGLESIGESEMRALLAENGLAVGAFRPALDHDTVSRAVMLADKRVGWMAVNVTGSYVSVEVKEESPAPEVEDVTTPCNVTARRDGRILRINAEQGLTAVKEGSGVVEGQVIVGGVMEDKTGGARFVHAKAEVIAETAYHADFRVPESVVIHTPTGEMRKRLTADLFGIRLPLTVGGVSTVDVLSDEREEAPSPLGVMLPAGLLTREMYALEEREKQLNNHSAKELLIKEARLYEVFTLSSCTVTDRKYRFSESENGYALSADLTCAEDIAVQEEINVDF